MSRKRILRVSDFQSRIQSVFSETRAYQLTSDQQLARITERVYRHPDYSRLTRYERGYLRGVQDTLQTQLWQDVVWMLGPATGPTREALTEWTEEMSVLCRKPGELFGGHFWKGTDKTYTDYKATN